MHHDNSEDPWGFWQDEPTRPLKRTHVGTRAHGDTGLVPVIRGELDRSRPLTAWHANPLAARIGLMVGVMLLLVPIALGLRGDKRSAIRAADEQSIGTISVAKTPPPAPTDETLPQDTAAATTIVITTVAATPPPTEAAVATPAPTEPPTAPPTEPPTTAAKPKKKMSPTTTAPPPAAAVQSADMSACTLTYTIVKGDAWSSIAARATVSMKALLAANGATIKTVLLPGKTLCLPNGAAAPGPPATQAPATTQPPPAPAPTAAATTQPTTPPATTVPPPQPAPPANTYSKAEAAQIIRDVWPDDLEDEAIRIATRESNLIPTVKTYCCYGLFQIYFTAHNAWLTSIGITSAAQLYDPRVNATAALSLYNRSGWAPWAVTPTTTTVSV